MPPALPHAYALLCPHFTYKHAIYLQRNLDTSLSRGNLHGQCIFTACCYWTHLNVRAAHTKQVFIWKKLAIVCAAKSNRHRARKLIFFSFFLSLRRCSGRKKKYVAAKFMQWTFFIMWNFICLRMSIKKYI